MGGGKDKPGAMGVSISGGKDEKPGAKPDYKPVEKPADKPADKPSDKPADKPADKPEDKPKDEKPAEKTEEKPKDQKTSDKDTKGRQVADMGTSLGRGPTPRPGGIAVNPPPDGASGGGQLKLTNPNVAIAGPGARPGAGGSGGGLLKLPANTLVLNSARSGGGGPTIIDPFGGKR